MRSIVAVVVFAFVVGVVGCSGISSRPATKPVLQLRYQGRDAESWGNDLMDLDEARSQEAWQALRELGPEGVPYLIKGLDSPSAGVRSRALAGLSGYGERLRPHAAEAVPLLVRMLLDEDKDSAIGILGGMGPAAKASLPELRKLANDPIAERARSVRAAIAQIEGASGHYAGFLHKS